MKEIKVLGERNFYKEWDLEWVKKKLHVGGRYL